MINKSLHVCNIRCHTVLYTSNDGSYHLLVDFGPSYRLTNSTEYSIIERGCWEN